MHKPILMLAAVPFILAACDVPQSNASGASGTMVTALPEGVLEIAAPYQDLSSARVNEATGCYVYLHDGPVESTYLPLRAANGQPICAREPEVATAAG